MTLRILVIEDDPDCADHMALLLRRWGHGVEVATDGPTALQAALSYQPDVVLLDIGLPGLSGRAVARRMHEPAKGKRPLLVALSGYGRECDTRQSSGSGVDLHLTKPVDPEELKRLLDEWQTILARLHAPALLGGPLPGNPGTAPAGLGPRSPGPACHEADRTGPRNPQP